MVLPPSHVFFTVSRGEKAKTYAVRPSVFYAITCLLPLLGAVYMAATLYVIFRDDMLAALMKREAEMQYAYEDRLAAMRGQLDRVTSRQLIDQDSFEGKLHELLSRQAQLETRADVVAMLANEAAPRPGSALSMLAPLRAPVVPARPKSVAGAGASVGQTSVPGFAPLDMTPVGSAFPPLTGRRNRARRSICAPRRMHRARISRCARARLRLSLTARCRSRRALDSSARRSTASSFRRFAISQACTRRHRSGPRVSNPHLPMPVSRSTPCRPRPRPMPLPAAAPSSP